MTDFEKPASLAAEIIKAQVDRLLDQSHKLKVGFKHQPRSFREKFEAQPSEDPERNYLSGNPDSFAEGVIRMHTSNPNYKSRKGKPDGS